MPPKPDKSDLPQLLISEIDRLHDTCEKLAQFSNNIPVDIEKNKNEIFEKINSIKDDINKNIGNVKDELNAKINSLHIEFSNEITALKIKSGAWGAIGALIMLILAGVVALIIDFFKKSVSP